MPTLNVVVDRTIRPAEPLALSVPTLVLELRKLFDSLSVEVLRRPREGAESTGTTLRLRVLSLRPMSHACSRLDS